MAIPTPNPISYRRNNQQPLNGVSNQEDKLSWGEGMLFFRGVEKMVYSFVFG